MGGEWRGEERRLHDEACDVKWDKREQRIQKWVCTKMQPTLIKQSIMWMMLTLFLTASLGSVYKVVAGAGQQKATDSRQDTKIENVETIVKEHHAEYLSNQEVMQDDIEDINSNVHRILGILQEHGDHD